MLRFLTTISILLILAFTTSKGVFAQNEEPVQPQPTLVAEDFPREMGQDVGEAIVDYAVEAAYYVRDGVAAVHNANIAVDHTMNGVAEGMFGYEADPAFSQPYFYAIPTCWYDQWGYYVCTPHP